MTPYCAECNKALNTGRGILCFKCFPEIDVDEASPEEIEAEDMLELHRSHRKLAENLELVAGKYPWMDYERTALYEEVKECLKIIRNEVNRRGLLEDDS